MKYYLLLFFIIPAITSLIFGRYDIATAFAIGGLILLILANNKKLTDTLF